MQEFLIHDHDVGGHLGRRGRQAFDIGARPGNHRVAGEVHSAGIGGDFDIGRQIGLELRQGYHAEIRAINKRLGTPVGGAKTVEIAHQRHPSITRLHLTDQADNAGAGGIEVQLYALQVQPQTRHVGAAIAQVDIAQ